MGDIWPLILSGVQTVIVGLLVWYIEKRAEKRQKETQNHNAARKRESLLMLEMHAANANMTYAVAMAVKRGHANGEVETAIEEYEAAKKAYYRFMNEQAVGYINE